MARLKLITLSKAQGDIAEVFRQNQCLSSGKNASVDGTGKDPSIEPKHAVAITQYVRRKFCSPYPMKVIDVGTGRGYLVEELCAQGLDGYGIEGYEPLARQGVRSDRTCAWDLGTNSLRNTLAYKCANLTTSFEVLEHVHTDHEDLFLSNLAYLADYHLASIHMSPGGTAHCNIKSEVEWLALFRRHRMECTVIGSALIGGTIDCSQQEFRDATNIYWPHSLFVILDMRNAI